VNLHEKLIEIRKSVKYLKKENSGYQYMYVSSSQALSSVREKMDELAVLLIPAVAGKTVTEYQSKKDGNLFLTGLDMIYTWVDAENAADKIECPWYAQGSDSGERGVGKAFTYAEKYFILKFFNIATDKDDPDAFQSRRDIGGKTAKKKPESYSPAPLPTEELRAPSANPAPIPVKYPEAKQNPWHGKLISISNPFTGNTNGKPWTYWNIETADLNMTTFDSGVAEVACNAIQDNLDVEVVWKLKKSARTGEEKCLAEAMVIID
jgi:hypothetical protein